MASDTPEQGSVTRWIGDLKSSDANAARALWERYFDGLVRVARQKLQRSRHRSAGEDEEDAALSAFDSLCRGVAEGRFEKLHDRDDLWRLLVVITARKAIDQIERRNRLKRGGGRLVAESELGHGSNPAESPPSFDDFLSSEPSPEFAVMIAEEFQKRLDTLGDDKLRQIALWRLEGYANEEIASMLGCVGRTVERKLGLIRMAWTREGAA